MKVINVIGIAAGVLINTQVMAAATCDDLEVIALFSDLFKCEGVMQCSKFGLNSANEFKTSYEEVKQQVEDTRYPAGQDNKKLLDLGTPGAPKLAGMLVDMKVKVALSLPTLLTEVTAVSADYNASINPDDEQVGQRWGKVEPALWGRRRYSFTHRTKVFADGTIRKIHV